MHILRVVDYSVVTIHIDME